MDTAALIAAATYTLLTVSAVALNRHIDQQPPHARPDGMTSLWVVAGVGITLAGAGVLLGLAWPLLAGIATRNGDWAAAVAAIAIVMSAFAASGLPMIFGDASRSASSRQTHAAVKEAREHLRSGQ